MGDVLLGNSTRIEATFEDWYGNPITNPTNTKLEVKDSSGSLVKEISPLTQKDSSNVWYADLAVTVANGFTAEQFYVYVTATYGTNPLAGKMILNVKSLLELP